MQTNFCNFEIAINTITCISVVAMLTWKMQSVICLTLSVKFALNI